MSHLERGARSGWDCELVVRLGSTDKTLPQGDGFDRSAQLSLSLCIKKVALSRLS
jgi:hypothetical protein